MRIRYLGQSGFLLETEFSNVIIDPGKKKDGNIEGKIVYCTHKHTDHIGGVSTFLEKNPESILLANSEVIKKFTKYEERTVEIDVDSTFHKTPWSFRFIEGEHGIMKGVKNLGVIIYDGEQNFGHPGDSVSLEGFYEVELDYLAVPIGGLFTASPKKILEELAFFKNYPKKLIPMHWLIRRPSSFCKEVKKRFPEIDCVIPKKDKIIS